MAPASQPIAIAELRRWLERAEAGTVAINGKELPRDEEALRKYRHGVGVVFQAFNLFPHLSALANIMLPLEKVHGMTRPEAESRAAETLRRGRQALILLPEIALTAQMVHRFMVRFPGQVGLVHSKLSDGERYDTWRRARNGQLSVIIGARSALFSRTPAWTTS